MKTNFIRINDISEIDTSKITTYDLNNRYIDARGNMYSLRYNRADHKVEIIRIIRTQAKNATYFQQKMQQYRSQVDTLEESDNIDNVESLNEKAPEKTGMEILEERISAESESPVKKMPDFNPDIFINDAIMLLGRHKERMTGIINNLDHSHLLADKYRDEKQQLDEIYRNLEVEAIQRCEKIISQHKELFSYPRSLSYYTSKLDSNGKSIVEDLENDQQKLKYVIHHELYTSFKSYYKNLRKVLDLLNDFLEKQMNIGRLVIESRYKKYFNDAKISIASTYEDMANMTIALGKFEDFMDNSSNYKKRF